MPDYKSMKAYEALRYAKEQAQLTVEEIAERTGIRPASLRRYFQSQEDGYCPGLDKLPALIRAFGNDALMHWLEAQTERERPAIPPARSRAEVLTGVARAAASLGDCQRLLADSEKGGLDPHCAREARSQLVETIELCRRACAMLESLAAARDRQEAEPLASVQKERWWERLWQKRNRH